MASPPLRAKRVARALIVVVAIDAVIAGFVRADAVADYVHGDHRFAHVLAIVGLVSLAAVLVELTRTVRHLASMDDAADDSAERLDALMATSYDWLWECDTDLVLTSSNAGVTRLLGYPPDQVIGRAMYELVDDADRVGATTGAAYAVSGGVGWHDLTARWRHADGRLVTLHGTATPIRDRAGRTIGFRGSRHLPEATTTAGQTYDLIRHRVDQVLADESLEVALQPIIDVTRGAMVGAEALARFPDDTRPDLWFADAHHVGLGVDLELLALRKALPALGQLPAPSYLSVNASPALITDDRFATLLADTDDAAIERLVVEITEHAAVDRYDDIADVMQPLRERGVRLAVDDTGAGYASFSHVLRLRPNKIKLDRSLTANISRDGAARALITAVVLLALELDAALIAEGVETAAELDTLTSLGVDYVQGYLLARPTSDAGTWRAWCTSRWQVVDPYPAALASRARDGRHEECAETSRPGRT